MKKFSKLDAVLIILATMMLIMLSMILYAHQVNQVIGDATIGTMQEMAGHDKGFVENALDKSVANLTDLGERLRLSQPASLTELQMRLNLEKVTSPFEYLFLVDEQGLMYSGTFLIQNGENYSYVQKILHGTPKTILRYDDYYTRVDAQEETLVYALTMKPFTVEGRKFVGLVGQTDLRDMRRHMNLISFGGQGFSMVVDPRGYYIVNKSDYNGIGQHDSLYQNLQEAEFEDGCSLEKIAEKVAARESFVCVYELEGQTYVLSMTPLELTDWYLAMTVPNKVFTDRSRQFITLTSIVLAVILLVIAFLAGSVVRVWKLSVEARANAEAKSDFLNKMSHEIRTPLNALTGLNYLMRQNLDDRTKLTEYLDKSASTSQYLLSLINDILDISKLNQSAVSLAHEPFSLAKMIDLLQVMMKDKMAGKKINFTVSGDFLQPFIYGDEMRLKQVLLNILGNAVKFTPEGGLIELRFSQKQVTPDRVITKMDILDNGIGMSKEFQHHIFESFTQESNRALKNREEAAPGGTGLGMAISYLLMKQMEGELLVDSTLGKGSCFTVLLPADIAAPPAAPEPASALTEGSLAAVRPLRVLVAEDNDLNALILTSILKKEKYFAEVASNGQIAVEMFKASQPFTYDVILMDAQMPVMNGYQAAQGIRELSREDAKAVMIYACTANTAQEYRDKALASGMNGFVAKPIDVKKLLSILNQISTRKAL